MAPPPHPPNNGELMKTSRRQMSSRNGTFEGRDHHVLNISSIMYIYILLMYVYMLSIICVNHCKSKCNMYVDTCVYIVCIRICTLYVYVTYVCIRICICACTSGHTYIYVYIYFILYIYIPDLGLNVDYSP